MVCTARAEAALEKAREEAEEEREEEAEEEKEEEEQDPEAAPQPGTTTAQTQGASQPAVGGASGLFGTQQADPPVWAHNSHPHYQNEHQLDTTRFTTRPDNTRIDSLNFGKSSHQATYNAAQKMLEGSKDEDSKGRKRRAPSNGH